jgi:hypothetical protein
LMKSALRVPSPGVHRRRSDQVHADPRTRRSADQLQLCA